MNHVVRQGECLSGIAKRYGFRDYRTIYNHPDNAELKKKRPNPNLIFPGDVIAIPDLERKVVSVPATNVHRFQVKSRRKRMRVKLEDAKGEPLAGHPYRLQFDAAVDVIEGTTDSEGELEHAVPEGAESARLEVDGESRPRILRFQHLNPLRDVPDQGASGVQARLANLGYDPGPIDGRAGKWTASAARAFARDAGLEFKGALDAGLLAELEKAHGC